jgi:hypothetical protein
MLLIAFKSTGVVEPGYSEFKSTGVVAPGYGEFKLCGES